MCIHLFMHMHERQYEMTASCKMICIRHGSIYSTFIYTICFHQCHLIHIAVYVCNLPFVHQHIGAHTYYKYKLRYAKVIIKMLNFVFRTCYTILNIVYALNAPLVSHLLD